MTRPRKVYGVGTNDGDYRQVIKITIGRENGKQKQKLIWECPFYATWKRMLERCYSDKSRKRRPSYSGVTVCEEWLLFSNFKSWMEQQDWEGKQLDKDLLSGDNEKLYSPETCCFVSLKLNSFLLTGRAKDSELIGCYLDKRKNKFSASCKNPFTGESVWLGYYTSKEDAHGAWLEKKLDFARQLAGLENDPRIANALIKRYENFNILKENSDEQ